MDFKSVTFLLGLACLFAGVTMLCGVLTKANFFKKLPWWAHQLCFAGIYGGLAILGSHANITFSASSGFVSVNVRDVAPLLAGLIWGPVAGVGAGLIGGFERMFNTAQLGSYSALACGLMCMIAGLIAGLINLLLRKNKKLYENKNHFKWYYAFLLGFLAELLHMAIFALTKTGDIATAGEIIINIWYGMAIGTGAGTARGVYLFKLTQGEPKLLPIFND